MLLGRGDLITNGLGRELCRRGFNVLGKETVGAQNALKTRSQKHVPHDLNYVASIQRQLDPLAFDPNVKKLTSKEMQLEQK